MLLVCGVGLVVDDEKGRGQSVKLGILRRGVIDPTFRQVIEDDTEMVSTSVPQGALDSPVVRSLVVVYAIYGMV